MKNTNSTEPDHCPICFELLDEIGANSITTNCGHRFCLSCYYNIGVISQPCPICRREIKCRTEVSELIITKNKDILELIKQQYQIGEKIKMALKTLEIKKIFQSKKQPSQNLQIFEKAKESLNNKWEELNGRKMITD